MVVRELAPTKPCASELSLQLLNGADPSVLKTCADQSAIWLADPNINEFLIDRNVSASAINDKYVRLTGDADCRREFAIRIRGIHVGHCSLHSIQLDKGSAGLSIVIGDPNLHNRGWGRQVMKQLQRFALMELGLKSIWLTVDKTHHGAIICYFKSGFSIAGTIKDHYLAPDNETFRDVYRMEVQLAV